MKKIRQGKTIQIGDYLITPVEKVEINSKSNNYSLALSVRSQPLGIIIKSQVAQWALNIEGKKVSIDDLLQPA